LLHESTLGIDVEGTGLMSIEHFETQALHPELRDEYSNCHLACRFCNGARGRRPSRLEHVSLLNPCSATWADHFEIVDHCLQAVKGDEDASYTEAIYDLNDPRKTGLRRAHAETLTEAIEALREGPGLSEALIAEMKATTDPDRRTTLASALQSVGKALQQAITQVQRFAAIPADADLQCRCSTEMSLPRFVSTQCWEYSV